MLLIFFYFLKEVIKNGMLPEIERDVERYETKAEGVREGDHGIDLRSASAAAVPFPANLAFPLKIRPGTRTSARLLSGGEI